MDNTFILIFPLKEIFEVNKSDYFSKGILHSMNTNPKSGTGHVKTGGTFNLILFLQENIFHIINIRNDFVSTNGQRELHSSLSSIYLIQYQLIFRSFEQNPFHIALDKHCSSRE